MFVEIANHLRWCDLGRKDTKIRGFCVVKNIKFRIFADERGPNRHGRSWLHRGSFQHLLHERLVADARGGGTLLVALDYAYGSYADAVEDPKARIKERYDWIDEEMSVSKRAY